MGYLLVFISVALGVEHGLRDKEIPFFDRAIIGQWEEAHNIVISKQQLYKYGFRTPQTPVRLTFTNDGQVVVIGEKGRRTQWRYQTILIGRMNCLRVSEPGSDKGAQWLYVIKNGYLYMAVDEDSGGHNLLRRVPMSLSEILDEDSQMFVITRYQRVSGTKGRSP